MDAQDDGVSLPPGYRLVRRLGSGGFATVWLFQQGRLGRTVAVKVVHGSLDDPEHERRFRAECQAIGRLSGHPAVVTVHDAGTTDAGQPYLVMEHLAGGSLQDRLARTGALPWPEAVSAAVSVADALAAAHAAGILHRDVKPANVLVSADGSIRLGDFGIARLAEGERTRTGVLVGTIAYTPPEVLGGRPADPRSDLWSLGITLYALLSGRSPFSGADDEPAIAAMGRIVNGVEPAPLPEGTPDDVVALVRDLMRADPGRRPADAATVVARLQGCEARHGLAITPARSTSAVTAPPRPQDSRPGDSRPQDGAAAMPQTLGGADPTARAEAPSLLTSAVVAPPTTDPVARAPVVDTRWPPHDATTGATQPSSPPPPRDPESHPKARSGPASARRLVVGAVIVLLLVTVVVGAVAVVRRSSDDSGAAPPATTDRSATATRPAGTDPVASSTVDAPERATSFGTPVVAPRAPATAPVAVGSQPATCGSEGCAVASTGSRLFAATAGGRVLALDSAGRELWARNLGPPGQRPGLSVQGNQLIIGAPGPSGRRYQALDADSGETRWERTFGEELGSLILPQVPSPTDLVFDQIADNDERGSVTALATRDEGRTLWSLEGRTIATTDTLVVVADTNEVLAVERATGAVVWRADVALAARALNNLYARGAVAGSRLVVTSGSDAVALDLTSGEEVWRRSLPASSLPNANTGTVSPLRSTAAAGPADVVVVSGPSGDSGLDAEDGTVRWSEVRPDLLGGDRQTFVWVASGGTFAVGRDDGVVTVYSAADGSVVAERSVGAPRSYVVLDGQILAWSSDRVVSVDQVTGREVWTVDGLAATSVVPAVNGFSVAEAGGLRLFRR